MVGALYQNETESFGIGGGLAVGRMKVPGNPGTYYRVGYWRGRAFVDLTPQEYEHGATLGCDGVQQVGVLTDEGGGLGTTAALWTSTRDSFVRLHPGDPEYYSSAAQDVNGGRQVGYMSSDWQDHGVLWEGSPDSAQIMTPPGFLGSRCYGISSDQIAGTAWSAEYSGAIVWFGAPDGYALLEPLGYDVSEALDVAKGLQVGYVRNSNTGFTGAALWRGSVSTFELVHDASRFVRTKLVGTNGDVHVGWGRVRSVDQVHALALVGRTGVGYRWTDLHDFLPPGRYIESMANGVDAQGRISGSAMDVDRRWVAVVWVPLLAPAIPAELP